MRFALLIGLVIVLAGAGMLASGVKLTRYDVVSQNNDIVLVWEVSVEQNVERYEVQRRSRFSNHQFVEVARLAPHGTGKLYQYRDDQVYKASSEQVDYRVEVVFRDGVREAFPIKSINYSSTAVRRTWGSIKAMFQ